MADGVAITAGSGTTILTDDTGASGHAQVVKLAIATDGSATLIPADAGGLLVNLGTNNDVTVTNATAANCKVEATIAAAQTVAVTNAGTFATQVDGSALTALQLIDDPVFADDAAFTVGTSKVGVVGGLAVAHGANPDAADALDAGAMLMNRHRVQFTIGGHPNVVSYTHGAITTAVTDTALVTVSAGTKIVVTGVTVTLDTASTVYPSVRIGFGTASVPALGNAGIILAHGGVPAGGGVSRGDGSGIIGIGADDQDLRITTVGNATGGGLQVTVTYYTIES